MRRRSALSRERARERMLALPPEELARRVELMRQGRERARSPKRLAEVEDQMARLGEEFKELPPGAPRRREIIRELRPLGRKWGSLKWNGG